MSRAPGLPFPLGADDPLELLGHGEEARAFGMIQGIIEDPLKLDAWLEYLVALRGSQSSADRRVRAEALEAIRLHGVAEAVGTHGVELGEVEALLSSPDDLRQLHFDALALEDSFAARRIELEAAEWGVGRKR